MRRWCWSGCGATTPISIASSAPTSSARAQLSRWRKRTTRRIEAARFGSACRRDLTGGRGAVQRTFDETILDPAARHLAEIIHQIAPGVVDAVQSRNERDNGAHLGAALDD